MPLLHATFLITQSNLSAATPIPTPLHCDLARCVTHWKCSRSNSSQPGSPRATSCTQRISASLATTSNSPTFCPPRFHWIRRPHRCLSHLTESSLPLRRLFELNDTPGTLALNSGVKLAASSGQSSRSKAIFASSTEHPAVVETAVRETHPPDTRMNSPSSGCL